jgi:hypothetical protein
MTRPVAGRPERSAPQSVSRIFPVRAHQLMDDGGRAGKIVLTL